MTSNEKTSRPLVCNFHATAGAGAILVQRCDALAAALAELTPAAQLEAICDTRALHRKLFVDLVPSACPDAAGTYRGTPGSTIAHAPRAVFLAQRRPGLRARDLCLAAELVPDAMLSLAEALCAPVILSQDPYGDRAFVALAGVTARFFSIHPYMDGNGHIWRLILPVLGRRWGLVMRPEWTIHQRPYGVDFSLALQWYRDHPMILADYLRRWLHR